MFEKSGQRFDTRWQRSVLRLHLAAESRNDRHRRVKGIGENLEPVCRASSLRDRSMLFDKCQHTVEASCLVDSTRLPRADKL